MYKNILISGLIFIGINVNVAAETYQVRAHNMTSSVTLSGTVIAKKEVTFTAQLPGRVEMLAGKEGDEFDAQTVLVILDDKELLAKRRAAIAAWRSADATLRNAGMQYSRELLSPDSPSKAPGGMGLPNLFDQVFSKPLSDFMGQSDQGIDRQAQLNNYSVQIEQARNALLQAKAQIEQIDDKLQDAKSISPFDGVITQKWIEVGDTVQPGKPLLKFADLSSLQIELNIPARLIRGLKVGQRLSASLDVLDKRIVATVAQIFPTANIKRHTIKVKLDIDTDNQYVAPGQYAKVDIPERSFGRQKVLLIPMKAVKKRGSLPGVCVLKRNNKTAKRLVRLGQKVNPMIINDLDQSLGDFVTVLSGLNAGDQIILNCGSR
ncbi:efflux RND transporter periplasmic adaptor subunit [Candidatus Marithrix sp. Canyon 246]|uniref:efflux RND transporter periplasmic adaptor subunit n=1 Tax=Candidatus Marithrix sp. Canyon 246 TaxID=1827136 RepID=UPI001C0E895E|nr:efflux RND transporter periplasmic adaptor subunit [Candidatus Marithrix sp. Canyon 246]